MEVGAVAVVMLMAVDVDGGCWGDVVAGVWWNCRWAQCLPKIAFRHQPFLQAHMQARISSRSTATPTDNPTSKWSMSEM